MSTNRREEAPVLGRTLRSTRRPSIISIDGGAIILTALNNPNGIREISEPGLPGKTVYLDTNDNGQYDAGEPVTVTSEDEPSTIDVDEAGSYSFFGVAPGSHRVAPVIEQGWGQMLREPRLKTERVSNGWEVVEVEGDSQSYKPSVSDDGRYVAFHSQASNLVSGDTNARDDIFIHDRIYGITERVSVASDGSQASGGDPSIRAIPHNPSVPLWRFRLEVSPAR